MPSASIRRKAAVVVAAIVRAVVALGRSLNMVTTAEDVAQLNYLKGEACDEDQGFYFGRAVSADEFVEQRLRGGPGIAP